MSYETILVERDAEGVALLTFNRPEKRNALDLTMVRETRAALQELAQQDVRALIFTGAGGKAFISGADIGQLRERTHADALRRINSDLFREIEAFPAPTIAAVRGFALGGGCELILACDLRVAGEGARLGQPEVGLGILPGAGATYRLPRLVGIGIAKELILTGRIVRAGEAYRMGLLNRVVPDEQVLESARELALEIAQNGALAVRLAKLSLNRSANADLDVLQALESSSQAILFDSADKHARMTAFLEKKAQRRRAPSGPPPLVLAGEAELELRFDQLQAFPPAAQVADVSQLVPKRQGQALRVSALLERVGGGGEHVNFLSREGGFSATQPREALGQALLVYALHDQPLPASQGGPYRLLIPDAEDACLNVKDVARIELSGEPGQNRCSHPPEAHPGR